MRDIKVIEEKNIVLISIRTDDVKFIVRLVNDEKIMELFGDNPSEEQDWVEVLCEWEKDEDEENYIIYRKSDMTAVGWIGVNGLLSGDKKVWIKVLAIMPLYWSNGYGTSSVNTLISHLKKIGMEEVYLWTDKANVRAQNCYIKNDFEIIKQIEQEVGTRRVLRDRVLMKREL